MATDEQTQIEKIECLPELIEYLPEFIRDRENEYVDLGRFLEQENFEKIRAIAHRWRGFCAPYGFRYLGELALELEIQSECQNIKECSLLLEKIQIEINNKRELIEGERKNGVHGEFNSKNSR